MRIAECGMWIEKWFILVLLAFILVACAEKIKPSVASTGVGQDIPAQESWNTTITFTDSGRVTAAVHAGHVAVFSNRKVTLLDQKIKVDFFNGREEHTSVLTAERGTVNDETHDLEAFGNVVVVSDSGTTLKCEELFWSNARQLIHTTAFVEVTSATEYIRGQGLESDQSLKNYKIFRVTGQAQPNE